MLVGTTMAVAKNNIIYVNTVCELNIYYMKKRKCRGYNLRNACERLTDMFRVKLNLVNAYIVLVCVFCNIRVTGTL